VGVVGRWSRLREDGGRHALDVGDHLLQLGVALLLVRVELVGDLEVVEDL
jgi:hypothetical protein